MSQIIVAYWSGTGNTEAMAQAIGKGITEAGGEARVVSMEDMSPEELKKCTAFALGCPAMGAEELEELERLLQEGEKNRKEESFAGGKPVKNAGKYRNPQKENGKRKQRRFL